MLFSCGKNKPMPGGNCPAEAKLHIGIQQSKALDMEKTVVKIVVFLAVYTSRIGGFLVLLTEKASDNYFEETKPQNLKKIIYLSEKLIENNVLVL